MKKMAFFVVIITLLLSPCCKKEKEITIKIPLVTWGGYAALFAANGGASPSEDSLFYKYGKFKVELIQEENPTNQLIGFAGGAYPIIWSTMDMLPIHYLELSKDKRTSPKVIGLFDYSRGGDGIIARGDIKDGADLKGKKIVTAQYTPSHYFILYYLDKFGLKAGDVNMIYVGDAILAKDAFVTQKDVDVCVTWSPFIYDLTDNTKESYIEGAKIIASTADEYPYYGLIADIYLARADFVEKNPEIIKNFTKAMIDGYDIFLQNKEKVAGQIADLFGIKGGAEEVALMLNDVTVAGKEENKRFFDSNEQFSAYNIFNISARLYKESEKKLPEDYAIDPNLVVEGSFMLESIK
ncbi:MAG TPA: ABC transporter substrate-binding protein [Spirochaetota bacterium]|nr:ABC transporter substrate-binding protein [Spirochaetota bacterium]HOS32920.1 ABC transporter substrate-binding protein [Spirochaetota bacterium]HOS55520.1 ABC transporter substrate-binding protein [Spirochaetota bacterium]HPK61576.1 ABC transporter substrate-binding protein [Spirochaetota bacterium]HQF78107.1 ABC transporter substrate-binding protein [Spirochaetota bacterium]